MTDRYLNKEILRLSIPSILANLTVPLVGFVDTAVAGHLKGTEGAAAFIGAISVGAMLFNLLYWNFSFLRVGTGGLTAQAFGRKDFHSCASIFYRGIVLALIVAIGVIAIQWPFVKAALLIVDASPEVENLAAQYFFARIWAAPATISLMAFSGWFVGMQDSVSSMLKDLTVNGVNIIASIILALGIGKWEGIGFTGIAWGTVIAQYCGLILCICICRFKYHKTVFAGFHVSELRTLFASSDLKQFFKMNADLVLRSLGFTAIYIGYTLIAATFGDTLLACSSIMMQILMIFSFFTDGFAYAGEALSGRFYGAADKTSLRRTVRLVFYWSAGLAVLFSFIYTAAGGEIIKILTSDGSVIETCNKFIPWLVLMPIAGCACFTWDGIFIGTTSTSALKYSMIGATVCFLGIWFAASRLTHPSGNGLLHLLLAAYFAHLAFRSAYMSLRYKKEILNTVPTI